MSDIEQRGVPAVMVASRPFEDAASVQSEKLGLDVASVFVSHPIQDRTDDEMRAIADDVVQALLESLTGP